MPIEITVTSSDSARRDALLEALARAGLSSAQEQAAAVHFHETNAGIELTTSGMTLHFSNALTPDDVASVARLGVALAGLDVNLRKLESDVAVALVAAMAAHDANNVLFAIQAGADELVTHEDDAVAAFARILLAGCRRIAATMRWVIKMQHGTVGRIDVNLIVRELLPSLTALVGGRARLFTRLESPMHLVWMDSSAIERALINLVANAGEAAGPDGRIVIASSARKADDGSHWVLVEIEDNGSGMDETTRARAFEPFFTTRADAGGTGLGLASVARAVREAGGRVELDSAPGRGTRFALWLPAA
jgi:signal transduction histidine kinase